ncbi:MAG: chromate efflux transporter [Chloroflexi bacterium]|nr:chromate efflux transporter [Chloroflexota bacterium]
MPKEQPTIPQLFFSFLHMGATAFGGPSIVAYIRKMAVEQKNWMDAKEFNAGVAFCQLIPGATAMQMAAYVGLSLRGVTGAAFSFIGFGLPAFFLMLFFAMVYTQTGNLPVVLSAFSGLQAVVVAIMANAVWSFGKVTIKKWRHAGIALIAAGLFWWNISPLLVISAAALGGWLVLTPPGGEELSMGEVSASPISQKPILILLTLIAISLVVLYFLSPDLYKLALLMIKVDLTAFGGGFASVPVMYHQVVEVNHWLDGQTFMNGIVLGQVTPGPIVITGTFIGYILLGSIGALVATLGIFLPSFLLVVGLAPFFNKVSKTSIFHKVIRGVMCSFVGLLISVTARFAVEIQVDVLHILLVVSALFALLRKVDILWVVVIGAVISIWLIH